MEGKRTVLLIEDAESLRETLCDLLQADGFHMRGFRDGASALEASAEKDFHIIIIDYSLPDMNGADVTKRLRARFPTAIIIGISLNDRSGAFLAAGANAFLQKPFEYDELVRLMNNGPSNLQP
jgi:DNA-binding response OmpR family regulator